MIEAGTRAGRAIARDRARYVPGVGRVLPGYSRRLRQDAVRESWMLRAITRTPRPGWHQHGACYGCRGRVTADLCLEDCPVMVRLDCLAAAYREEAGQHDLVSMLHVRGGLSGQQRADLYKRVS